MNILGYGEDALTLWAMTHKLPQILATLADSAAPATCQLFLRPSFGRRGGAGSPQFGEFDFILLTTNAIYLGESKWDRSSESIRDGRLILDDRQQLRHALFAFYIEAWAFGQHASWHDFVTASTAQLQQRGISKPIAANNSHLATNLQAILRTIQQTYRTCPPIQNVLLYCYQQTTTRPIPHAAGEDFTVVALDYTDYCVDNFIKIAL